MIRRPPRSTRTDTLFPTRRSSDLMFTTGMPTLSTGFFSAASMAVSIPAGIQVFSWIATLAIGKPSHNVPTLFVIGGLVTFVMGGLTGVMVAMVPFDWQAHDTHFIVAHLHYVLIGGAVMPVFAARSEEHTSELQSLMRLSY